MEALAENTTVIAVNTASLLGVAVEQSGGDQLAKPSVTRTPSNRSANDTKDVLVKVVALLCMFSFVLLLFGLAIYE